MLLLLLLQQAPAILLLTLAMAMYLTVIELRDMEPRPHFLWWFWWLLLVLLTHFIGYLILRAYVLVERIRQARA